MSRGCGTKQNCFYKHQAECRGRTARKRVAVKIPAVSGEREPAVKGWGEESSASRRTCPHIIQLLDCFIETKAGNYGQCVKGGAYTGRQSPTVTRQRQIAGEAETLCKWNKNKVRRCILK